MQSSHHAHGSRACALESYKNPHCELHGGPHGLDNQRVLVLAVEASHVGTCEEPKKQALRTLGNEVQNLLGNLGHGREQAAPRCVANSCGDNCISSTTSKKRRGKENRRSAPQQRHPLREHKTTSTIWVGTCGTRASTISSKSVVECVPEAPIHKRGTGTSTTCSTVLTEIRSRGTK